MEHKCYSKRQSFHSDDAKYRARIIGHNFIIGTLIFTALEGYVLNEPTATSFPCVSGTYTWQKARIW